MPTGGVVIVVDDGLATRASIRDDDRRVHERQGAGLSPEVVKAALLFIDEGVPNA